MSLSHPQKVELAIRQIRDRLAADPRRIEGEGKDFLFIQKVLSWIDQLTTPSDGLLLASWGHTLDRWKISRKEYPMNTEGYHQWRHAQSRLSAEETEKILREADLEERLLKQVRELILKINFPKDPESQVLEDADCLAFLETKLESYLTEWDEKKIVRILRGTLAKMTRTARQLAQLISYKPEVRKLVEKAMI